MTLICIDNYSMWRSQEKSERVMAPPKFWLRCKSFYLFIVLSAFARQIEKLAPNYFVRLCSSYGYIIYNIMPKAILYQLKAKNTVRER